MYPASHSYFISIDKPTVVLKHFFWKFSERILFNLLRHLQSFVVAFKEHVQNIEKSKASTAEVVLCFATVKEWIQETLRCRGATSSTFRGGNFNEISFR